MPINFYKWNPIFCRHNCCKSFHKNKLSASNSQSYDDVISFIKVQKTSPIDLLELAKNPESLSNQRAEYFLAKSNIEPASVWSALLIHVLKGHLMFMENLKVCYIENVQS